MADNTRVNMTVRGASVVTVPIDDTLAIAGQAADAKAVGDALDAKVDAASIMQSVQITWNGIQSDNQGVILADADDLPVDENDSVKDVLDAHGEDIDGLGEAIEGLSGTVDDAVLVTAQTLTDAQKAQVRANIGAVADDEAVLVAAQELTDAQKTQVRTNIGAVGASGISDVIRHSAQTLTAAQQGQARANIDAKCLVVTGTMTTTGSLTIQNAGITADMVVANIQLANAGAVAGAMTWSTADGSMSLSCSCYANVGVTVYLVHTA